MQSLSQLMNQCILGRRYPLNKSHSAWLEIGISIVPKPAVRITIINRRNQQVAFSEEAWHALQLKKEFIMNHLSNRKNDERQIFEKLDNVSISFGQVHEYNAVSFHGPGEEEVIILRDTCENLFNMYHSVLNVIEYLDVKLETVNHRMKVFKSIVNNLQDKNKPKVYEAIVSDQRYNKQSIVDTELASLCIEGIVWNAAQ